MPLRLNALLCRSYTCPCQCSATPLVCYSMPKHYVPSLCPSSAYLRLALAPFFFSMPSLCISPHCPHISALPSHPIALPKPCSAQPRQHVARTLHRYSMPLLRYARLDLSVQCLSDTILVIATASHFISMPLLCLSSPCPCCASLCHLDTQQSHCRTSLINTLTNRFIAFAIRCHASTAQFRNINQALPTQTHPCHCFATGLIRYSVRSRANP